MRFTSIPVLAAFAVVFQAVFFSIAVVAQVDVPPVKITSAFFKDGVFSGTIAVSNIAYQKLVQIIFSDGDGSYPSHASSSNIINAAYSTSIQGNNVEIWQFSAPITSNTKTFFAKYTVDGAAYYDSRDGANYQIPFVQSDLPHCDSWYAQDNCVGGQITYQAGYNSQNWQTPPRGAANWQPSYQDFSKLTGYADVVYDAGLKSATINAVAFTNPDTLKVMYSWNGGPWTQQSSYTVDATIAAPVTLAMFTPDSPGRLDLDPIFLIWNTPAIDGRPETNNGQKGAIAELWGWPYADVAKECVFLGKAGYMGVKIWPPNESVLSNEWLAGLDGQFNPWYLDYQVVSYRLGNNRHGTLAQLKNMIDTCRANGVRVYADAVINHMTASGDDKQYHRMQLGNNCNTWGNKSSIIGSPFYQAGNTYKYNEYTRQRPGMEYPAVPYGPTDFHCRRDPDFMTPFGLQYGWLSGLADLDTSKPYVQDRIATYLVSLLSIGFSGFRIDAAKHISPADLTAIFSSMRARLNGPLPPDFITWLELLVDGNPQVKNFLTCEPSEYNYYQSFNQMLSGAGLSDQEISQIKIWSSDYPTFFPVCGSWVLPPERFVIQNDCHDQQVGDVPNTLGDKGTILEVDKDVPRHRYFETQLFTRTDNNWQIRAILSGFSFGMSGGTKVMGYPDGFSDCARFFGSADQARACKGMKYTPAYNPDSCGYDVLDAQGQWVFGQWTRTHRDFSIVLAMRKFMGLPTNVTPEQVGLPSYCKAY